MSIYFGYLYPYIFFLEGSMRVVLSLVLAGLCGGCAVFAPGIGLEPPQVSLTNIRIGELGLFEQRYILDLRIRNPNAVPLPIVGMDYTLLVNGQEFARGVSGRTVEVAPFGEEVVSVDVIGSAGETLGRLGGLARGQAACPTPKVLGDFRLWGREVALPFAAGGAIRAFPEEHQFQP